MKKYRFVGSIALIAGGAIRCERLGQIVEVEDRGSAALITEDQFAACGFTEDELARYGHHEARQNAPEEFMKKLRKAWAFVGVPEDQKPAAAATNKKGDK